MKKLMVLVLSLGLLFGVTAQALAAAPADMAKNAKQNGQAKHAQFRDMKGHWAESVLTKVLAKGYVKGYEDGTFQPNKPVTEMEAIKMIVSEMTKENDTDENISDATSKVLKHAAQVPAWGQNYVEEAVESGILTDAELLSFRPNQGAKRIQVALWISRAMDLDERIDTDLDLKFLDKADISTDLYNAVVLVCEAGLMKGNPDNRFLPNKPITRAEMAVLLDRMDEKDSDDTLGEYSGTIKAVDDDSITIKHGGWSRTFKFDDDMTVKIDGEDAEAADLEKGYQVKLVLNDDGKVTSIKATSDDEDENDENETVTYEGKITLIADSTQTDSISLKTKSITRTFKVDEDTEITVDGDDATLEDLEAGWEAEIEVKDNVALSIKAESDDEDEDADEETEYEGTIDDIDGNEIIIEDEDGDHHTLTVNDDTEITIEEDDEDNDDATIDDLKTGDKVEVKADDGIALKIEVDRD